MNMKRLNIWMEMYGAFLIQAIAQYPTEYAYSLSEVPMVLEKMRLAFERGSYNKDSRAIKSLCKDLGLKHTYQSINSYLNNSEVA